MNNLDFFKFQPSDISTLFILTGAGLDQESGIETFRSQNGKGIWDNHDIMEVCSASGFKKNIPIYVILFTINVVENLEARI